jgi:preprotein translocase subunit SecD
MLKNLRWRIVTIVAVVALAVFAFYPPASKINLGLDLKGGVHLILRVKTDDALRLETQTTVERLRDTLTRANVPFTTLEQTSPTEFRIDGLQDDAAYRQAAVDPDTLFERSSGVGGYTYRMRPLLANQRRDEAVTQALETIERRVNELGVAEPIVARHSGREQILVQLPGVSEVQRAKDIIRSTAQLELRLVEQGPFPTREGALQAYNNVLPADAEILPGRGDGTGSAAATFLTT